MREPGTQATTKEKPLSKPKIIAFFAVLIAATLTLGFAILEFGLARYYSSNENQHPWSAFDPVLGWRLTPGVYQAKPSNTFRSHPISINSLGMRNREIETPANGNRVVLLGDSFAFASAVREEDAFPAQIEEILGGKDKTEIVNTGVFGYGTAQELLWMKELADKGVTGNLYVLLIVVNDMLDNVRLSEYGTAEKAPAPPGFGLDESGHLQLVHKPEKAASSTLATQGSHRFVTVELLSNNLKTYLQTKPGLVKMLDSMGMTPNIPRMPSLVFGWYTDEPVREGVPITRALISEMRDEAERRGSKLLVAMVPSPLQIYPQIYDPMLEKTFGDQKAVRDYLADPYRPQRTISDMCTDLSIPFMDLREDLQKENSKVLYFTDNGHFTKDGHTIAGRKLAEFIGTNLRNAH